MNLVRRIKAAIRGYRSSQSGVTAPIIAIMFTGLVGMAGYAIDMGHVAWVQRQLQASADAAALAGALSVGDSASTGQSLATSYSGSSSNYNAVTGASSVTTTATPTCFAAAWVVPTCASTTSGDNGIVVIQTATVPTYFLKIFGINSFKPTATAKASAKGGSGTSLNVMVVLDTTASMSNTKDSHCGLGNNAYKIDCAKAAAAALLQGLNLNTAKVGFMTYPPLTNSGTSSGQSAETSCSGGTVSSYNPNSNSNKIVPYNGDSHNSIQVTGANSNYLLMPLSGGFRTGTSAAQILVGQGKTSSGQNCSGSGLQAPGGVGTFFGDAVNAAEEALERTGASNAQNVMILLSDGDAGANASYVTNANNQCQQAVTNAHTAAGKGTWIYTVAYGANSFGNPPPNPTPTTNGKTGNQLQTTTITYSASNAGCSSDNPSISPCTTMQNMASDSAKFFSDGSPSSNTVTTTTTVTNNKGKNVGNPTTSTATSSGACTGTGGTSQDMVSLFQQISASLTLPRLVPNTTT